MYGMMMGNQNMRGYNPWREMDALERAFFGAPHRRHGGKPQGFSQLRTDVTDKGDHFLLEADLPGFDKQDIAVEICEDVLTVQAERKRQNEETDESGKVIRTERSRGFYKRSFNLSGVDADGIKAKYENGVLRLTLPKLEQATNTRRLEIE